MHCTVQKFSELHSTRVQCIAQYNSSVHCTVQFSFLASQPPDNPDKVWRSHFSSQFSGLPPLHSAAPGNILTILQLYNSIVLAFSVLPTTSVRRSWEYFTCSNWHLGSEYLELQEMCQTNKAGTNYVFITSAGEGKHWENRKTFCSVSDI